jgi:hypothetical protein
MVTRYFTFPAWHYSIEAPSRAAGFIHCHLAEAAASVRRFCIANIWNSLLP